VAIGLDRRHLGVVRGVTVRQEAADDGSPYLLIEPVVNEGVDASVEVGAASVRARLAGVALDRDIVIRERPTP
jgi:hypothetical protein